jgi:hypothetical protein
MNQVLEGYCQDYEALFCTKEKISSESINLFVIYKIV